MIFYNGFNFLVDAILVGVTALWFHGAGYRKAKSYYLRKYKDYIQPPF